jgi:Ig-like domain from next to BRCA1 gene/Bacterial Ig domain
MLRHLAIALGLAVLGLVVLGCDAIMPAPPPVSTPSHPTVTIASPPGGSIFAVGQTVAVQSTSTDTTGIVRVALIVDGVTVREDPSVVATGQQQYSLIQNWVADKAGQHSVIVRATNAEGATTDTGIYVIVQPGAAEAPTGTAVPTAPAPTLQPAGSLVGGGGVAPGAPFGTPTNTSVSNPTATVTLVPTTTACTDNATFVADLTVPDGTSFAPGASFDKSWRVLNSGTCAWQNYALVYVSDTQMAAAATYPVPTTAAGGTADLTVPMTAPAASGSYTGTWRLRSAGGTFFGTLLTVSLTVGSPTPTVTNTVAPTATATNAPAPAPTTSQSANCSGQPTSFAFTASAPIIKSGQSVTLNWGAVNNASEVTLSGGKFSDQGVPSPGSITDSPTHTTTYTLTATCSNGGGTRTKSVTVTVDAGAVCSGTPPDFSFTADYFSIKPGQTVTLSWGEITNVDEVRFYTPDGTYHDVGDSGSAKFEPQTTSSYFIDARCNASGTQRDKFVKVYVNP